MFALLAWVCPHWSKPKTLTITMFSLNVLIIIIESQNTQYTFRLSVCFEMYCTNVYKCFMKNTIKLVLINIFFMTNEKLSVVMYRLC